MFVGLGVFADEGEDPLVGFVVGTERYPVELTVMLHILEDNDNNDDDKDDDRESFRIMSRVNRYIQFPSL